MPSLRGLSVSCRNVDDDAISMLPTFPALRELMPMEHFFYGLLLSYPMREAYIRAQMLTGRMTYTIPITITLAFSALYEIIEWAAAEIVGGELGTAYLGTQGDVWDAQKDMALAGLGSILAMAATFIAHRRLGKV
jgi:putative membrane protein